MQQTETDERWYVQFDSGQVQLMTLEELDAAFDAGEVHENTFVIQVGETEWQTLADVAGLSDSDDDPAAEPVAEADPETTTLYTPAQAASLHVAAQVQVAPAPRALAPGPSARPAVAAAAGGWPPVATPAAAPQSTWPPVVARQSGGYNPGQQSGGYNLGAQSGGYNLGPQSMAPVVNDLDFDAPSFKSGRKSAVIAALAVIPALAGGGYALTRLDMPPEAPAAAAAAPVAPPKTSPWAPPPSTPTPPATPTPTPEAKSDIGATGRLSDDMKKALLASDSSRTPKQKARSSAPAARKSASNSKKTGGTFKASGSANDPLNSKL